MFRGKGLQAKIGAGFSLLIVISAVLGIVSWRSSESIRLKMEEYGRWGDIDMTMNEEVIQKLMKLENVLLVYRADAAPQAASSLRKSVDEFHAGLGDWEKLIAGYPQLTAVYAKAKGQLGAFHKALDQYQRSLDERSQLKGKWKQVSQSTIWYLEKVAAELIDPALDETRSKQNAAELNKWLQIDLYLDEELVAAFLRLQNAELQILSDDGGDGWSGLDRFLESIEKKVAIWRGMIAGEEKQLVDAGQTLAANLASYKQAADSYRKVSSGLDQEEGLVSEAVQALYATLKNAMEEVIDPAKESIMKAGEEAQQSTARLAMILTLISTIGGALLAVILAQTISKPIRKVISGLNDAALGLTSISSRVSDGSQHFAEGATEQAAAIKQTSESLGEISSMTKNNADHANEANGMITRASEIVTQANNTMNALTGTMRQISKASEETGRIVKSIDSIAFQTNLLALNAAVEAARAGEVGASFAVVANEVRNLSLHAAEAAKNTAVLIEGTIEQIRQASVLVERSNSEFSEVALSVVRTREIMGEIAEASGEQALEIDQISATVAEMEEVTERNASAAEESAATSEEMRSQAINVERLIVDLGELIGGSDVEQDQRPLVRVRALREKMPALPDPRSRTAIVYAR